MITLHPYLILLTQNCSLLGKITSQSLKIYLYFFTVTICANLMFTNIKDIKEYKDIPSLFFFAAL